VSKAISLLILDQCKFGLASFYQNIGEDVHEWLRRDEVSMSRVSFSHLHS